MFRTALSRVTRFTRATRFSRCAIALLCCGAATLAQAGMQAVATEGAWTVYAGRADDGRSACVAQAQGGGKTLGMKYFAGERRLVVHLMNTSWNGRAGLAVEVKAEFDRRGAWTRNAQSFTSNTGTLGLEFSIPSTQIDLWVKEFERSDRLVIRFPDQRDITDWSVSLDGSDRVMAPFVACMAAAVGS